jgi:hypothetical protein
MESKNVSLKSSGKKDYKTGKNTSGKSQLSTGSNTTSTGFNEENDQNSLFKVFEKTSEGYLHGRAGIGRCAAESDGSCL